MPASKGVSALPIQHVKEGIEMAQQLYATVIDILTKYSFQVIAGLLILFIGFRLANWVSSLLVRFLEKRNVDKILAGFAGMGIRITILAFIVIAALEKFGVTISPLIASVSALVFGASFAVQAPLSNFAAGFVIILTRPFHVGDTITVKNVSGQVEAVKLPSTVLLTEDGERITIPNKEIVGEILWNSKEVRVVELEVGVSYSNDPEAAIAAVRTALAAESCVSASPTPQIGLNSFGESSLNIGVRYWVATRHYHQSRYAVNMSIYREIKRAGLTIPFPQREVRVLSSGGFQQTQSSNP